MTRRIEGRTGFVHPPRNAHRAAKQLSADQARKIADAEGAFAAAKAKIATAEKERNEVRAKYRARIPTSVAITVAGVTIKITPVAGGRSFSLKGYLDAGHKLTAAMREFVSHGSAHERWAVDRKVKT